MNLPPLPLDEWRPTKDTLHLWAQIVGKVRLAHMPRRDHSWHVTLQVSVRGFTTGRIPVGDTSLEIDLDLVDHKVHLTTRDSREELALRDGLSVAEFYAQVMSALDRLGLPTAIKPEPYGVPMTTPFPDDEEHRSYDRDAVARFHEVLTFADTTLQEFAGWFSGKSSPVQLFWHSFDLAHSRFWRVASGTEQEMAFGFWAGDDITPAPTFYAYVSPQPDGLPRQPLRPSAATWFERDGSATAHLPYESVRQAADPRGAVLDFYSSVYDAGAALDGWDVAALATPWAPTQAGDHDG